VAKPSVGHWRTWGGRWQRAKHWITSPNPAYIRKKRRDRLMAAVQGLTAVLLIWDHASWHISRAVRTWLRQHNPQPVLTRYKLL